MPNIVSTGMTHYRKLIAWEKAVAMTERVYRLTADFPHGAVWAREPDATRGRFRAFEHR
jgi:hypothetical protein